MADRISTRALTQSLSLSVNLINGVGLPGTICREAT
jgi:hypothetical protein